MPVHAFAVRGSESLTLLPGAKTQWRPYSQLCSLRLRFKIYYSRRALAAIFFCDSLLCSREKECQGSAPWQLGQGALHTRRVQCTAGPRGSRQINMLDQHWNRMASLRTVQITFKFR